MPRQPNDGIPTPPPVAGPSGGGVPGLPKPMSPMGGGPGQGLGGVPEPDDLAGMLRGFSSGTVPPDQIVQAMKAKSGGPGGVASLVSDLGGTVANGQQAVVFSPEARALIRILVREYGFPEAQAIAMVAQVTKTNGPGGPPGAPPGGPVPGPGGPGGPGGMAPPTPGGPIPGAGVPNLGAQTGGPV